MYSTIKKKIGHCRDCPEDAPDKPLIRGLCPYHYQRERATAYMNKSKIKRENDVENKSKALAEWFEHRMEHCEPVCQNCGKRGDYLKQDKYKKLWHSCQAHLLPKSRFHSVRTHPLNGIVLGSGYSCLCHCHDDYDHDWERASKMKIWGEVVEKFKYLYPLISVSERRYIPDVLMQTI